MCPVWLLVVAVVGGARGTVSQCWEHPSCNELSSESNMLECIQLCRSDLQSETPVYPGDAHLQPLPLPADPDSTPPFSLSPSSSSSSSPLLPPEGGARPAKRSYSMEHFRWGKPVGRKRRPIKVFTASSAGLDDSSEGFAGDMRRELSNDALEEHGGRLEEAKKDGYKMSHFRWSGPPPGKRYGGFMKSWDERSQKPLLTLFRNVIIKDHQGEA